jgi:hypothetical protein
VISRRRIDQYFLNAPQLDEPYYEMSELIEANECNQVGLILSGDTAEYLLWVFLDTPRPDLTIDWIISRSDTSGRYRLEDFQPCAVVCEGCLQQGAIYNNLPLVYDNYGYRLYLENDD